MSPLQTKEGFAAFRQHRTWFRVAGDLDWDKAPLVVIHGGPGMTHDYVEAFARLAEGGRPVVLYDQVGNGRSSRLGEADRPDLSAAFFRVELENLLAGLGIGRRYAVLGQSWGAAVALEHAVTKPPGLVSLVLANGFASLPLFRAGAMRLRWALPAKVREALERHEERGDFASPEYQSAVGEFLARHVCRLQPFPDELIRSLTALGSDPFVFATMFGPSVFMPVGVLRDWSIVDRLGRIGVPTLAFRGAFDEVAEEAFRPFVDGIAGLRTHVFASSSHLPHIEEPDACLALVSAFLDAQG